MSHGSVVAKLPVAFCLRPHCGAAPPRAAFGASQAPHHLGHLRVPARKPCERLWLRDATVATRALQKQDVLDEMVGEPNDGQRGARGHQVVIVARAGSRRPYS